MPRSGDQLRPELRRRNGLPRLFYSFEGLSGSPGTFWLKRRACDRALSECSMLWVWEHVSSSDIVHSWLGSSVPAPALFSTRVLRVCAVEETLMAERIDQYLTFPHTVWGLRSVQA